MPRGAPFGATNLIPVQLFPNANKGYGYGRTTQQTQPEGYDHTINMTVLPDVLSPSFAAQGSNETNQLRQRRAAWAIPWVDANGFPIVIVGDGITAMKVVNNAAATAETTANTDDLWDACFHDDGATTGYIYVGTAKPGTRAPSFLNRRDLNGTWSESAGVIAKFVTSAAGALWGTLTDNTIRKCPLGSDPFTAINWGAAITVGPPTAKITSLNAIAAAPVIGREDGIWVYNEADTRFENQYPVRFNTKNFPFMSPDGEGGLYTATAFGDLIHVQKYGTTYSTRPLQDKPSGRDTPRGPITHVAVDGDLIYAYSGGSSRFTQPSGLKVLVTTDNFSTFTDYSASATDLNTATTVELSGLNTLANGDAMLIGFDSKFRAARFLMSSGTLNANAATMTVRYSTGAGTWTTMAAGSDVIDDTLSRSTTNGVTLGRQGFISWGEALASQSDWTTATYGGFTKYWVSFSVSAILSAPTRIAEVSIVVERPAPQFSTTNNNSAEVAEASGQMGKILTGRRSGESIVWDDQYSVMSGSPDARLCIAPFSTINSPNSALFCFSRSWYTIFQLPPTGDPSITDYPSLSRDGGNFAAPVFYPSAVDMGELCLLRFLECQGEDFTEDVDQWGVAFRWGETNPWSTVMTKKSNVAIFEINDEQGGTVLHTAFQILDAVATDPVGPKGRRIIAWLEPTTQLPGSPTQAPRTIPEVA